jgi:hypothetical protein
LILPFVLNSTPLCWLLDISVCSDLCHMLNGSADTGKAQAPNQDNPIFPARPGGWEK